MARTVYRVPALSAMRREAAGSSLQRSGWLRQDSLPTSCLRAMATRSFLRMHLPSAFLICFAGCLGGVPRGSMHKEAILVENLQLVDEAGKYALIQAVVAYPSMLFVLCGRCPLPGWLAEYELAPRAHDRA